MKDNVEILTDFVKPLENSVLDDFMAFAEKLIDNGILLEVKDVIALFKMLKADQKQQDSPPPALGGESSRLAGGTRQPDGRYPQGTQQEARK